MKASSPFGACRLCVVEIKRGKKWELTTSCNTEIAPDMTVRTDSPEIRRSRKVAAELLYFKFPGTRKVREMAEKTRVKVEKSSQTAVTVSSAACVCEPARKSWK